MYRIVFIYFREKLTLAILKLKEKAVINRLRDIWWNDRSECEVSTSDGQVRRRTK